MLHLVKKSFLFFYSFYIRFRADSARGWKLFYSKRLKLQLLLNLNNLIDFLIWEKGAFEEEVLSAIDSLGRKEPFLFLNVGSQLGQFSLYVKKNYPQAEVISFEPYQPAYLQQKINMLVNQLEYAIYDSAVSNRKGNNALFSPPSSYLDIYGKMNPAMTSLLPDLLDNAIESSVATLRLDDFHDTYGKHQCILLKIDVEGGESLVLSGANNLLQSAISVYLIIELLYDHLPEKAKEIDSHLKNLGYVVCNAQWEIEKPLECKNGNFFYKRLS